MAEPAGSAATGSVGSGSATVFTVTIVFLINRLDQTVRDDDELRRRTGLTPLGHVPFAPAARTRMGELVLLGGSPSVSEAYRSLRTNFQLASVDRPAKTIVITSGALGEGKSRTAANLAIELAMAGNTTLLLDADFRRPSIHGFFGTARSRGFSDLILGDGDQYDGLIRAVPEVPNLWLLAAGASLPNLCDVLGSARVKALIGDLASRFDYVILDTPPLKAVPDPALLAAHADGTLVIMEQGRTDLRSLIDAKEQLDHMGARVLGVVVNKTRATGGKYGYAGRVTTALAGWQVPTLRRARGPLKKSPSHLDEASAGDQARAWIEDPKPYRLKRCIDLCIAVSFLFFAMPVLALAVVAILVESGRPVLFKPLRLGRDGTLFSVYKLRTMHRDAQAQLDILATSNVAEGMVKIVDDPRVTRVGRWLRRFSVDELPQLWNVIRGEMSLVGPRPHDVSELIINAPEHIERLSIKPGLTGLWQIRARSDPSLASRVYWDLRYVASCSLSLDLQIMFETVPAVFRGTGGQVDAPNSHGPAAGPSAFCGPVRRDRVVKRRLR